MSYTKPSPDEAFKLLTKHIGGVLRECGFTGSGQNYRRERGEQWQAINVQKSQWRIDRNDPIQFYINIGIDYPRLQFQRWAPLPATISKFIATQSDTRFRIEDLFPECNLDSIDWFTSEGVDGENVEAFCARLECTLRDKLVPMLNEMSTSEGMARVLRMLPWMVTRGSREFVGKELAPPEWDPADRDAGKWKQDEQGMWWKQSE